MAESQYIKVNQFKWALYLLAGISFVAMVAMEYDSEFKITMLLPVCYIIVILLFVKPSMGDGIGRVGIIVMYAFRMCILPVICAYGNFWLEPEKSVYINYYGAGILLNCLECIIVFVAMFCFYQYYKDRLPRKRLPGKKNLVVKILIIVSLAIVFCLFILNPDLTANYRLLIAEEDGMAVYDTVKHLHDIGSMYYLLLLIDVIARPILSFLATDYFLKKDRKIGVLAVGIINMLIVTDRRILSVLIGGCCLVQLLPYIKQGISKKALCAMMGIFGVLTVVYCFYGTTEPYLIARKFQRYFSGPTLTAIGIVINQNFTQGPIVFLKRLFNDSIILTGLFQTFELPEYTSLLKGGYGLWTPMMIGSIQYFGIFAPIAIIIIVWFAAKCDYIAKNSESGLYKLMMNYLSISVAIYMVMYSVELIFYTILFFGGFYRILMWLDRKIVRK